MDISFHYNMSKLHRYIQPVRQPSPGAPTFFGSMEMILKKLGGNTSSPPLKAKIKDGINVW